MALHFYLLVESYRSGPVSGHRGEIRVRAVPGQAVDSGLYVRALRAMREHFPEGTKFLIRAKISNREGGGEYVNTSNWHAVWPVDDDDARRFLRTGELPRR